VKTGDVGTIAYGREVLSRDLFLEALPLLQSHSDEVMPDPAREVLVDLERYLRMEWSGMIRCYTIRLDKELIGYASFIISRHPHYSYTKQALCDVLYVKPEHRGSLGGRFLGWCDEQLSAEDLDEVHHTVQVRHDHGPLLERLGYGMVARTFSKRLR